MSRNSTSIDEYRAYVADAQYSLKDCNVHFIADVSFHPPKVIRARVYLQNVVGQIRADAFSSKRLKAGAFRLSDIGLNADEFLNSVLKGVFPTPEGALKLYPIENTSPPYSAYFDPLHDAGVSSQVRISVLKISGKEIPDYSLDRQIQWDLRASRQPFDSFQELANAFLLADPNISQSFVEFVAFQSVGIVSQASNLKDGIATIQVELADGLEARNFHLGVRADLSGEVSRYSFSSSEFSWSKLADRSVGTKTWSVDEHSILQCFANYNDVSYGFYWLHDPTRIRNSRMVAYETLDPDLEHLRKLLLHPDKRKGGTDDFEKAAQWLFWLLGFNPSLMDSHAGLNEAPDMIIACPSGNLIICECTIGNLKAGHKIAYLIERTERIRKALSRSGQSNVRILPCVMTCLTSDEIKIDLPDAFRSGVFVLHYSDIERLVGESRLPLDPEGRFNTWYRSAAGE